jgi:glycosyltransferase involved in cell wall biosynthesis
VAVLDVLIPTYRRPAALAALLTSLGAQTCRDFRVIVSDQTEEFDAGQVGEVLTARRILELHGNEVTIEKHLPRRGLAEQRQFLLDQARSPYALFLDDDLVLEPWVVQLMVETIEREGCGFVGCAPIGLSYLHDVRPHEQAIEFWDGPVRPEEVHPRTTSWERYRLHNAANPVHVQQTLDARPDSPRTYRVAWVGACVLYDTEALRASGGFSFWEALPAEHSGEDVLAQLRVMARFGGCGVLPSGVYHQELPTTIIDRTFDAARHFA